jgi:hypothetical protein
MQPIAPVTIHNAICTRSPEISATVSATRSSARSDGKITGKSLRTRKQLFQYKIVWLSLVDGSS